MIFESNGSKGTLKSAHARPERFEN